MNAFTYLLSFLEGMLTFISPCILPLLPVYFFYLAGTSGAEEMYGNIKKGRLILNSIGFVAGFTIIFIALGATATTLGSFLKEHIVILRRVSGIVMVLFGLNFMGVLRLGFLNVERRLEYHFKELGFFNSIIFGMVFGFGWTPCLGAFLGSALLMAGSTDTIGQGILMLLVYSLGLGIPFLFTAVLFEKVKESFRRMQKYNRIISVISGMVLILAGVLVFTDNFKYLSSLTGYK